MQVVEAAGPANSGESWLFHGSLPGADMLAPSSCGDHTCPPNYCTGHGPARMISSLWCRCCGTATLEIISREGVGGPTMLMRSLSLFLHSRRTTKCKHNCPTSHVPRRSIAFTPFTTAGFDTRVSNPNGSLGAGSYFAEHVSRSLSFVRGVSTRYEQQVPVPSCPAAVSE